MKITELFEYRLFKSDEGFNIYKNPSSKDVRTILQNSHILNLQTDEPYGSNIHGSAYPLRGIVVDNDVYIIDSYDADHDTLTKALYNQGVEGDKRIPIIIARNLKTPQDDLENYMIGAPSKDINDLKNIPAIIRMKMLVKRWGLDL